MKTSLKTALLIFTLSFISVQIFAQDTYKLNYKYEKGKTYFYNTNMTLESVQNMMGQEINGKVVSKSKMRLEVTDATPTQTEIITSLDSLYSKSSNPMGGDDIINNGDGIVGKKTKMIYDNLGKKIKKIEIDVVKSDGGMSGTGGASVLAQLSDKPVKVGDVWTTSNTDTTKMGEDGKMVIKSDVEYKIEGKDKFNGAECLKISFKGTMKLEGSMTQQSMSIVIEGAGKTTGNMLFDHAKGLILSNDSSSDMNMTAAVPEQSITIPITQTVKANMVIAEK